MSGLYWISLIATVPDGLGTSPVYLTVMALV